MADDVKVKFGGDFSDVAKGAGAAAKSAGNMLGSALTNYATGLQSSIASMLSIENIVAKISEGMQDARDYFKEIGKGMKTTGVSAQDYQRVLTLGKSEGIGTETVNKALGIFSKYIGNASKDASKHGKVLTELGFSQKQISSGAITATSVLQALAKQYEKTGNASLMAANSAAVFGGRTGKEMIPLIKKGSDVIEEGIRNAKVYTQTEIDISESAERYRERRAARKKGFFRAAQQVDDMMDARAGLDEALRETKEDFKATGKTDFASKEFLQAAIQRMIGKGITPEAASELLKTSQKYDRVDIYKTWGYGGAQNIQEALAEKIKEKEGEKGPDVPEQRLALSASTLQQIGAGDVNSILAASYQADMLDTSKSMDASLKRLVENNPFKATAEPAKAGR